MENILEITALAFCVVAIFYPLYTASHYINTTKLGRVQMFMFIGEAVVMAVTTVFAILAFMNKLSHVSHEIQSIMRIFMCCIAIYTSRRVHKVLREILDTDEDGCR